MKNIAIVFLGDFFYDARCINIALTLQKNYNVFVLCSFKKNPSEPLFSKITFVRLSIPSCGLLKYYIFYKKALAALNKLNLHTIISGDLYSLASASHAKHKKNIIYDCREIYSDLAAHQNKPLQKLFSFYYERHFLKYANKVLVTADSDLSFLKKKYFNHKHLTWSVIYNFPSFFKRTPTERIKAKKKNTLIVYQGVLQKGRGIRQLIYLSSLMPNVSAVIIGGGKEQKKYVQYAKNLKVLKKTIFIKKTYYVNLLNYTLLCDIGWAVIENKGQSNHFALPNKLFEYGLCGLPTIASFLPNMQTFVDGHALGIVVPDKNIKKQIEAVQFLIQNKKSKPYYKNIIKLNFSWESQSKKLLQIVNE